MLRSIGDPVPESGDRVFLTTVLLQASDISAVDDLVSEGTDPTGATYRTSIGVHRDPKSTASDAKSVPLVRSYLEVVTNTWTDVAAGTVGDFHGNASFRRDSCRWVRQRRRAPLSGVSVRGAQRQEASFMPPPWRRRHDCSATSRPATRSGHLGSWRWS